ncbi:hypothetical protein JCM21900_002589, partial [Sporobolomyces salmonicolor]
MAKESEAPPQAPAPDSPLSPSASAPTPLPPPPFPPPSTDVDALLRSLSPPHAPHARPVVRSAKPTRELVDERCWIRSRQSNARRALGHEPSVTMYCYLNFRHALSDLVPVPGHPNAFLARDAPPPPAPSLSADAASHVKTVTLTSPHSGHEPELPKYHWPALDGRYLYIAKGRQAVARHLAEMGGAKIEAVEVENEGEGRDKSKAKAPLEGKVSAWRVIRQIEARCDAAKQEREQPGRREQEAMKRALGIVEEEQNSERLIHLSTLYSTTLQRLHAHTLRIYAPVLSSLSRLPSTYTDGTQARMLDTVLTRLADGSGFALAGRMWESLGTVHKELEERRRQKRDNERRGGPGAGFDGGAFGGTQPPVPPVDSRRVLFPLLMRAPVAALAAILVGLSCVSPSHAVWPAPRLLKTGSTCVQLRQGFEIVLSERLSGAAPSDLVAAVELAKAQVRKDRLGRLIVGRGESDREAVSKSPTLSKLELSLVPLSSSASASNILSISEEAHKPYEELDESYTLSIPSTSSSHKSNKKRGHFVRLGGGLTASLKANTTLGLARGLQTFTQLVYALPGDGALYIPEAPIEIEDWPAFAHRGFMLDTARNFYPVADILRTLQTMATVKLNVFHWHATDSQAWPLLVPAFPYLSKKGAYDGGEVYGPEDVKEVQRVAGGLGITVMIEIGKFERGSRRRRRKEKGLMSREKTLADMPGHTASIKYSYPDYIACFESSPWATYANEPPAGQLRLGDDAVLEFSKTLVKSVSGMFDSKYFSTGGDEINTACYTSDPVTGSILNSTSSSLDDLLGTFVEGVHEIVREAGKTPVVWEELVLDHGLKLGNSTIVLVWVSSANIRATADLGYRIIHAASDYLYLDCGQGGWVGDNVDGNSWCDPFKTWQKIYSFDPFTNLTTPQHAQVLGGETLLWSEQTDPNNLDPVVWPRVAAGAEVWWTGGALNGTSAATRI